MNRLIETAAGLRCLSPREARMRIEQLQQRLEGAERDEQLRIQREIDRLRPSANPELMYGEWSI